MTKTADSPPEVPAKGPPTTVPAEVQRTTTLSQAISWILVLGFAVGTVFSAVNLISGLDVHDWARDAKAAGLTSALGITAVFLLVLTVLGGRDGVFASIIGKDSRYSTSKATVGLWVLFVSVTLPYLLMKALALYGTNSEKVTSLFEGSWEQYAVLIGGPAAAAVLAKGITTWKVDGGQLQKPPAEDLNVKQLGTNDEGSSSMSDAQYLLFNLIALLYASAAFIADGVWVEIPAPLLGLTSVSASLYVGAKAATRNAPLITAVAPAAGVAGTVVTVSGENFKPEEAPGSPTVLLGTSTAEIGTTDSQDSSVTFEVPADAAAGPTTITLVSSARVATRPTSFTVLPLTPTITGWTGNVALTADQDNTLNGTNLAPPPGGALVAKVNGFVVPSQVNADGTAVVLSIPGGFTLPTGGADVELVVNGTSTGTVRLTS